MLKSQDFTSGDNLSSHHHHCQFVKKQRISQFKNQEESCYQVILKKRCLKRLNFLTSLHKTNTSSQFMKHQLDNEVMIYDTLTQRQQLKKIVRKYTFL